MRRVASSRRTRPFELCSQYVLVRRMIAIVATITTVIARVSREFDSRDTCVLQIHFSLSVWALYTVHNPQSLAHISSDISLI